MRIINTKLYVMAIAITIVIFILGLLLGVLIEGERVEYIEYRDREQEINFNSLQLQYLFLSALEEKNGCNAFLATLDNYIENTEGARVKLEKYLDKSNVHEEDFNLLKREYIISQINYWILSMRTRDMCNEDFVTVLYFFSKECDECENQGFVLDYLKRIFKERLLIFAIDASFPQEPMISIMKDTYNITQTPALIIEGEKFVGFQSKDKLIEEICSHYSSVTEDCG